MNLLRILVIAWIFGSCAAADAATDQPPSGSQPTVSIPSGPSPISAETIATRQKQLVEATDLDEKSRKQAEQFLDQALEQLRLAEAHAQESERWQASRLGAPAATQQCKEELATSAKPFSLDIPPDSSMTTLNRLLADARQRLDETEGKLRSLQQEPARRNDRRMKTAELGQAGRDRILKLDNLLNAPPSPGTPESLVFAQRTLYEATRLATQRELEALNNELPAYDATAELLELETQGVQRAVAQRKQEVQSITAYVARQRKEQADEQERQARVAAIHAHPTLQPVAERNVVLTQMRTGPNGLTEKIQSATDDFQKTKTEVARLRGLESDLQEKSQQSDTANIPGPYLLQVRGELPRIGDLQHDIYDRNQTIAGMRFQLADVRRQKDSLNDSHDVVTSLLADQAGASSGRPQPELEEAARDLFKQRQELLHALETDSTAYFNLLNEINALDNELLGISQRVQQLVDDNLMWVRGHNVFGWSDLLASGDAVKWLVSSENWRSVAKDARKMLTERPLLIGLCLLTFVALAIGRSSSAANLRALGCTAATSYLVPFGVSLRALGFTLLLTMLWPSLILGLGFCLYTYKPGAAFSRAVAAGLIAAGFVYLILELTRRLLGHNGLAEDHFRWGTRRIRITRRNLLWISISVLPIIFVLGLIHWDGDPQRQASLGRLLFMICMALISLFMQRVLRTLPPEVEEASPPKQSTTSRIVFWGGIWLPELILGLSLIGYHFTAWQLALRLFATFCVGLGVLIFHGLAVRWLRLVRGRLAMEKARQRREAREQAADLETNVLDESQAQIEAEIDLQTVNIQTRRLVQVCVSVSMVVGLWLIWLEVLPAENILQQPLWSTPFSTSSVAESESGTGTAQFVDSSQIVTRADLVLAILVLLVALLASRNIPGLVEVSLPPTAPLDAGARYALSTIIRYTLIAFGVIFASTIVGIGWSKVQWLVAALSVGVGFGLQELVSNFISGLILLFERPVRVGDVVTVDGVSGIITRVQIRATTISNWDRQDYIVPNKDLITGRVLNWTLNGELNRIVVKVGVAYDSDPRFVRGLLFEILGQHANVLEDPAPLVTFEEFGDSVLQFVVRAYLASMNERLETTNDLHTIILERFKAEGIEIAFPQRDINIRSIPDNYGGTQ